MKKMMENMEAGRKEAEDRNKERDEALKEERRDGEKRRLERDMVMEKKWEELGTKIEKNIEVAIEPIKNRLDNLEQIQKESVGAMEAIEARLNILEKDKEKKGEKEKESEDFPRLMHMEKEDVLFLKEMPATSRRRMEVTGSKSEEVRKVMERASRTISIFPVPKAEVDKIREEIATEKDMDDNEELNGEALHRAAEEFIKGEMGMRDDDWEALKINEIFTPKGDTWRTIYIEINTLDETEWIMSHCRNMKKEGKAKISNHVPWQARERHNGFERKAKLMRDLKFKTRIVIRDGDYLLKVQKKETDEPWKICTDVDDIPGFSTVRMTEDRRRSPRAATGRKMRTLAKHSLSPDSAGSDQPNKKAREERAGNEEDEETSVEDNITINDKDPEESRTTKEILEDERRLESSLPFYMGDKGKFTSIDSVKNGRKDLLTGKSKTSSIARRSSLSGTESLGPRSCRNTSTKK